MAKNVGANWACTMPKIVHKFWTELESSRNVENSSQKVREDVFVEIMRNSLRSKASF